MARVTQERNGITYVYESTSYYDKEKHQSRSRRKLIGKLDPETGAVIPTGKVGRPRKSTVSPASPTADKEIRDLLSKSQAEVRRLEGLVLKQKEEISSLRSENRFLTDAITGIIRTADDLGQQLLPFRK